MDKVSSVEELRAAFEKLAKTRAQKEAIKALERGDTHAAGEIAKGYGELGLAPRYLKDISTGGQEAAVDLMMGAPGGKDMGGLVARKLYKPDSRMHQGDATTRMLDLKQRATDFARQDPEMRPHVADMAGYRRIEGPHGPQHVSFHEFVPHPTVEGMIEKGNLPAGWEENLGDLENKVLKPLQERGLHLRDVIDPDGINPGNIAMVPGEHGGHTAKALDFLPRSEQEADPLMGFVQDVASGKQKLRTSIPHGPGTSKADLIDDIRRAVFEGQGGSRQAPKARVGPAGAPRFSTNVRRIGKGIGEWAVEHPGQAAGAVAAPLLAGGALYGAHELLKDKAASIFGSFFEECAAIAGLSKEAWDWRDAAMAGAGGTVLGGMGGALAGGEEGRLQGALYGAGAGALTGATVGGLGGMRAPGDLGAELTVGIPLASGTIAGVLGTRKKKNKGRMIVV